MNVTELWNYLLVRSGQFILKPSNIKLDQEKFIPLVSEALSFFNKNSPYIQTFNLSLAGSNGGCWEFTEDFTVNGRTVGIPYTINSVVPLRLFGVASVNLSTVSLFGLGQSYNINSLDKSLVPYEYREPVLYTALAGDYDVQGSFLHKLSKETSLEGEISWNLPTLSLHNPEFNNFFSHAYGLFLIAIGRSRRAFTLDDLPIKTDADALVSEGLQVVEKAKQDIVDMDQSWFLAWT